MQVAYPLDFAGCISPRLRHLLFLPTPPKKLNHLKPTLTPYNFGPLADDRIARCVGTQKIAQEVHGAASLDLEALKAYVGQTVSLPPSVRPVTSVNPTLLTSSSQCPLITFGLAFLTSLHLSVPCSFSLSASPSSSPPPSPPPSPYESPPLAHKRVSEKQRTFCKGTGGREGGREGEGEGKVLLPTIGYLHPKMTK